MPGILDDDAEFNRPIVEFNLLLGTESNSCFTFVVFAFLRLPD